MHLAARAPIDMPANASPCWGRGRPTEDRFAAAGVKFRQARPPGQLQVDARHSWAPATSSLTSRGTLKRSTCWLVYDGVRYINTSLEVGSIGDIENKSPYERSLYSRQMRVRLLNRLNSHSKPSPTAIMDHGANPARQPFTSRRWHIATTLLEQGGPMAWCRQEGARSGRRRREPGRGRCRFSQAGARSSTSRSVTRRCRAERDERVREHMVD
jgi:hypothetical protein